MVVIPSEGLAAIICASHASSIPSLSVSAAKADREERRKAAEMDKRGNHFITKNTGRNHAIRPGKKSVVGIVRAGIEF
jgi:hypothetical protein